MMNAIEFKNTSKKFNKFTAVNDVSINVSKGEIIGFVGPNGAGKTTAISMLLGFIRPSSGTVSIFGHLVKPESVHILHKHVGYAAGDIALFDNLTGQQYLDYFANQYGSSPSQKELIEAMKPRLAVQIKQLSRGNKQKIAIIGALQHNPQLIILDEPTTGLDPLMQKTFIKLIEQQKARGATVFMSSHILSEVAEVSDRVIFMRDGKIIINQEMSEIRGNEGKIVTFTSKRTIPAKSLPKGASDYMHADRLASFIFNGNSADLVKWLSANSVTDFTVSNRTLDDLFEHLYEQEATL